MGIQSSVSKSSEFLGIKSPTQTTEQLMNHLFPDENDDKKDEKHGSPAQQRTSTPINKNRTISTATVSDVSFPPNESIERAKI